MKLFLSLIFHFNLYSLASETKPVVWEDQSIPKKVQKKISPKLMIQIQEALNVNKINSRPSVNASDSQWQLHSRSEDSNKASVQLN